MTTLILITYLDDFILDYFIEEYNHNECVVIGLEAGAHRIAKEAGLPSQFLSSDKNESPAQRDRNFAQLTMPGVFGNREFLNTNLEIWEALSIDRLSFWYGGANIGNIADMISALDWDRLVTALDIHHPAPFYFMSQAKESIAICSNWGKELSDICPHFSFNKIITTKEIEPLLERNHFPGKIETRKGKTVTTIDFQRKDGLRTGLGIGKNERVTGVIYDKKYDWACRYTLKHNAELRKGNLVFFCEDARSAELLPKTILGAKIYDRSVAPICNQFIAFGYEPYLKKYGDGVQIIDPFGLNSL